MQDHLDHGTVMRLHQRFGKQLAWCGQHMIPRPAPQTTLACYNSSPRSSIYDAVAVATVRSS